MKPPAGLHLRKIDVEGIGPWVWIEDDRWAFAHPAPEFASLRDAVLAQVAEPQVILQAGGCMGMYPRLWSESFQTVYTFEPDPLNFYCLVANCASERIVKMQAALSNVARMGALHMAAVNNSGAHWLSPIDGQVPVLPLDAFAFRRIDALQLDCEGHEAQILEGARATLARCRPVVALEAPNAQARAILADLGYAETARVGTMPDVVFSVQK